MIEFEREIEAIEQLFAEPRRPRPKLIRQLRTILRRMLRAHNEKTAAFIVAAIDKAKGERE